MFSFSKSSKAQPPGASMRNIKITLENLVAILNDEKYSAGIDPLTMSHTIDDIYRYISGDASIRIRCPAPMSDIEDRFQLMWPEGARVSSRQPSESSRTSRYSNKSHHLSRRYTSGNIDASLTRRAMSVTSSQYSRQYVGFIDEEEEGYSTRERRPSTRRGSSSSKLPSTIRVNGAVVKPTPSLEKMFAPAHTVVNNSSEHDGADYKLSSNSSNVKYDDEKRSRNEPSISSERDFEARPARSRHNEQSSDFYSPEPIDLNKVRQKKAGASNVGFAD